MNILARVGEAYITKNEVEKAVPNYLSGKDSIEYARQYIDNWIYQELLYSEALKNLQDTSEISRQVDDYRKSLFKVQLEQQLVNRKLDTLVRKNEIEEYYYSHLYEFVLTRPVIKMHAIILNVFETDYSEYIRLLKRTKYEDIDKLFSYCNEIGMNFVLINNWLSMDDFYKLFPCSGNMLLENLEINEFYECYDENLRYLIIIDDVIETGNYAPIEVLHDNIKKIILQKRSRDYLAQYRKQLYIQAEGSGYLYIKK
ncbi:MAG: hypothetical protein GX879_02510 [Bacteroidales bacterium]|nr:hypothetical protein [Bacteroidales bacterium]